MSLKTVFLLCFGVACLPAIGWSGWTALRARTEWSHASSAVRVAEAMGDAMKLMEVLSIERGALLERAVTDGPITGNLVQIAARDDALLDRAETSMRAAGMPDDAVVRSRQILLATRAKVAAAITRPAAERDPGLLPALTSDLYEPFNAVSKLTAEAERAAAQADPAVGALVTVSSLALDMRAAAGWRSTTLSAWFAGKTIPAEQLDQASYMTGVVQFAWERLQRQVLVVGDPPRLAAAIAATRDGFVKLSEPRYRAMLAIARAGGERPLSMSEWRRWTVEALPGSLLARDAAVSEALERGAAKVFDAQMNVLIAAATTMAMLCFGAGAFSVLLRRLVLPVERLTAAVTQLAGGDVMTVVPERGRDDEIGAMAAAIEVFRENALELLRTNLRFDAAIGNMSQGLAMYDANELLVVANPRLADLSGLPPGSLRLGMTYYQVVEATVDAGLLPGQTAAQVYSQLRRTTSVPGENLCFERQLGKRLIHFMMRILSDGGWLVTLDDITERRLTETRIAHMAHHDALTGMPNRVLFHVRLQEALARAGRGESFSVLFLDLDRFKAINDTLGHPVGDALLRMVASRLQAELRDTDTLARLGGDEFAILQAAAGESRNTTTLAERLIEVVAAPYQIAGHQIDIGVSIGIAVAHSETDDPGTLLKHADLALYRAKADGRGTWRFFEAEMDAHMQARRLLELDLRKAVEAGRLEVCYQPVVDLHTRELTGFEALLRWHHPVRGFVSPAEFIPLAEEIGLIEPIGEWALNAACRAAADWPDAFKVAVNLSPMQFRSGSRLADKVDTVLRDSGLAARRLELEITEITMLRDTEETLAMLHRMQDLGVAIVMDDFGTGYSSLSHLRRFPFDRVKIDPSFVRGLGDAETDASAIVRAVIALCASLRIAVTAEGVETEAQLAWLAAEGRVQAQGYLFSRPVSAGAVPALIERFTQARMPAVLVD